MTWAGMLLGASRSDTLDLSPLELINPFISLFAILLVFLGLALFLAMILPGGGSAGLLAGFLLIASYFITSLTRLDEDLAPFNRFSPLKYYQGGDAIKALDIEYLLILLGISVVFLLLAWFFFVKRDFRFGGSGGFRINLSKKAK